MQWRFKLIIVLIILVNIHKALPSGAQAWRTNNRAVHSSRKVVFLLRGLQGSTTPRLGVQHRMVSVHVVPNILDPRMSYLFLESQPETADKAVEISDRAALNVNFTLSSTSLRSGTAHADLEAWDLIRNGIFNDDYKLNGDCQVVYCCYNPGCEQCSQNLFDKYPNFRCPDWTPKGMEEEEEDSSSAARLLGMAIAVATGVLGLLLN